MASLFWSSPFEPPARYRLNWETGASGTASKVVREPSSTLSIFAAASMSIWPSRSGTRSGRLWLEDRR